MVSAFTRCCLNILLICVGILSTFCALIILVVNWDSCQTIGAFLFTTSMIQLILGCCSVCCSRNTEYASETDVITSCQRTEPSTIFRPQQENVVIFMITLYLNRMKRCK